VKPEELPVPNLSVDATGKFCPVPVVEVAKAVLALQPGQVVELLATDPGVQADVPAWCKATKHELLALWREGKTFKAFVRKR
jgi:TusA-related sulfurtransferase